MLASRCATPGGAPAAVLVASVQHLDTVDSSRVAEVVVEAGVSGSPIPFELPQKAVKTCSPRVSPATQGVISTRLADVLACLAWSVGHSE